MILFMDPPEHDRMRSLVSRVFTPRAISQLGAHGPPGHRWVRRHHRWGRVLRPGAGSGRDRSPWRSSPRCWGSPPADRQQIRHWLDIILHREEGSIHPSEEAEAAGLESGMYYLEPRPGPSHPSRRRHDQPADRGRGRAGGRRAAPGWTTRRSPGSSSLLAGAGAETVTKLVGNAAVLFCRQSGPVAAGPGRPGHDPRSRRGDPPVLASQPSTTAATCWRSGPSHGVTIPAGQPVLLIAGSATRDERQFDDPDRFDITRPPSLALGFGYGIHSCLGAALARMESRIAIAEMARRWPTVPGRRGRLAPGDHGQRGRLFERPGGGALLIEGEGSPGA